MKYGFAINLHRCIGCRTCTVACKMEHRLSENIQRIRVLNDAGETTYDVPVGEYPNGLSFTWRPVPCQHCDNPVCVEVCPAGATYKREDGIVVVDEEACIGCGQCVAACPYGAITVGDLDDPESDVSKLIAQYGGEQWMAEAGTSPNVYYFASVPKKEL